MGEESSMITIKFSHQYVKFPPWLDDTILYDLEIVDMEDLDPKFIEEDTAILGGGHYPLPKKGKFLILRLCSYSPMGEMKTWQTIRRWTPEKEAYYRKHIKEQVKIEVTA